MNPQPPPPPPPSAVPFLPFHHTNLPPPPPPPSLSATLSNLTSLLHLSNTALRSLPSPITTASASPTFLHCPFNPNHRLPPSSLFSHYLNCQFSLSLPHTFLYPLTRKSSTTAIPSFLPTTSSSDLSVSLDNYAADNANFFYENCPGPVTPSIRPPSSLSLPRVLHIECADSDEEPPGKESMDFPVDFIRFIPSEIWAIRSETEAWGGGLPAVFSSRILRAILRLRDCNLSRLNSWIVSSSIRYGVIIDFAMRDHVVLLVRLCLKAIVREAFVLRGVMFGNGKLTNQNFEFPVLLKVMMWLASQLSVLYGEVNGKLFAVDVLKECVLGSALHASWFLLEQKDSELRDFGKVDGEGEEPVQSTFSVGEPHRGENTKGETVGSSMIFISQVAASAASLHERSLFEEKLKVKCNSQPVSAYERNMEHAYMCKIADEERLKRPDYRPIIEHDGFLWQRSNNQETNKFKTREELLAEERDYKRRRMSYRGKKSKRNTSEVMRDIIEEYMEEIKQAGGIGDNSENVETKDLASENLNTHVNATGVSKLRRKSEIPDESRGKSEIPDESRGRSLNYRKDLYTSRDAKDVEDDIQRLRRDSSRGHGGQDSNRSVERIRHGRDDYSGRRDGRSHQRRSESREQKYYKRNRDEHDRNNYDRERDEHERNSRKREKHENKREHGDRGKSTTASAHRERDVNNGGHADMDIMERENSRSHHREHRDFDDRYDPAESRNFLKEDF